MVGRSKCSSRVVDSWLFAVVNVDDWQSLLVDNKPDPDDDRSFGDVAKFPCSMTDGLMTDGLITADDVVCNVADAVHGLLDV